MINKIYWKYQLNFILKKEWLTTINEVYFIRDKQGNLK